MRMHRLQQHSDASVLEQTGLDLRRCGELAHCIATMQLYLYLGGQDLHRRHCSLQRTAMDQALQRLRRCPQARDEPHRLVLYTDVLRVPLHDLDDSVDALALADLRPALHVLRQLGKQVRGLVDQADCGLLRSCLAPQRLNDIGNALVVEDSGLVGLVPDAQRRQAHQAGFLHWLLLGVSPHRLQQDWHHTNIGELHPALILLGELGQQLDGVESDHGLVLVVLQGREDRGHAISMENLHGALRLPSEGRQRGHYVTRDTGLPRMVLEGCHHRLNALQLHDLRPVLGVLREVRQRPTSVHLHTDVVGDMLQVGDDGLDGPQLIQRRPVLRELRRICHNVMGVLLDHHVLREGFHCADHGLEAIRVVDFL
mmetsp:Transcript_93129/g.269003  ORF Transcript_93129/g.269003 Transcript_93129/m.269003 type:complete len:369 (+) Transcript_93129:1850-2956(+)